MTDLPVVAHRRSLVRGILVLGSLLVVASVAGQIIRFSVDSGSAESITRLFFLDGEQNLPTWFQSILLLACSALLFLLGGLHARSGERPRSWTTMGAVFLVLAFDESASLHERAIDGSDFNLRGPLLFGWVVAGVGFVAAFVLTYARFLMGLDVGIRRSFLLAGVTYVSGALGIEMISASYVSTHGFDSAVYAILLVTVEESLEMLGIVVLVAALLRYLHDHFAPFTLSVTVSDQNEQVDEFRRGEQLR